MSALPATEPAAVAGTAAAAATPWYRPLWSTLAFLAIPAVVLLPTMIFDVKLPSWAFYGVAGFSALVLAWRSASDPEWAIAAFILYIPFSKVYVASYYTGVNGTNAVFALLIFGAIAQRVKHGKPARPARVGTWLMTAYAILSVVSFINAGILVGFAVFYDYLSLEIRGWCDQFLVFFLLIYLIRDRDTACRVAVYLMIGTAAALASGGLEWLDRRHMASIEQARVIGPHLQPNDYGAFLVYSSSFFLAVLLRYLHSVPVLIAIPPVLALMAKVLLATFSRGAYLAMGLVAVTATYLRGKWLLAAAAVAATALLALAPELIPESLVARMSQTGDIESEETMDASSRTRLILWDAAIDITLERPIFGLGFKMFHVFKDRYTEYAVKESDNHNMFLYLASQFGIPCLLVFLLIFLRLFMAGVEVYRRSDHYFTGTVGLAAASMVPAVLMINMFGSRMVDIRVSGYVWITLAVISRLYAELPPRYVKPARAPVPGMGATAAVRAR